MLSFQLSYDYRCPFANIIHRHVVTALRRGADFDVTFVPWTMSQGTRAEGSPDVWDDPSRDEELLALAVSVSIRDQQPEFFLEAHEALFRARHEDGVRLRSIDEIKAVLAATGVDLARVFADVESRRPHKVIGTSFAEFERYEAFGVPTFVVGNDATFVRYMVPPTDRPDESVALIESLVNLMTNQSSLNEFKHTTLPM